MNNDIPNQDENREVPNENEKTDGQVIADSIVSAALILLVGSCVMGA